MCSRMPLLRSIICGRPFVRKFFLAYQIIRGLSGGHTRSGLSHYSRGPCKFPIKYEQIRQKPPFKNAKEKQNPTNISKAAQAEGQFQKGQGICGLSRNLEDAVISLEQRIGFPVCIQNCNILRRIFFITQYHVAGG